METAHLSLAAVIGLAAQITNESGDNPLRRHFKLSNPSWGSLYMYLLKYTPRHIANPRYHTIWDRVVNDEQYIQAKHDKKEENYDACVSDIEYRNNIDEEYKLVKELRNTVCDLDPHDMNVYINPKYNQKVMLGLCELLTSCEAFPYDVDYSKTDDNEVIFIQDTELGVTCGVTFAGTLCGRPKTISPTISGISLPKMLGDQCLNDPSSIEFSNNLKWRNSSRKKCDEYGNITTDNSFKCLKYSAKDKRCVLTNHARKCISELLSENNNFDAFNDRVDQLINNTVQCNTLTDDGLIGPLLGKGEPIISLYENIFNGQPSIRYDVFMHGYSIPIIYTRYV